MRQLQAERAAVAKALKSVGLRTILFEDLGGRDDDAERAYLDGVERSGIYVGIIGDRYGMMLPSGRSPTNEEYRLARDRGKRISVWVAENDSARQGDARDFVSEIQVFHTTGSYRSPEDLAARVVARVREIAADAVAPWVKLGDAVVRAESIVEDGHTFKPTTDVYDPRGAAYLESLRADGWGRGSEVQLTTAFTSAGARVETVRSESRTTARRTITVTGRLNAARGTGGMDASTGGYSPEDQVELGLRVGMFGEQPPETFRSHMGFMLDTSDPLALLTDQTIGEDSFAAIARLLVVERLIGGGKALSIDAFRVGPAHHGRRAVALAYTERQRYANQAPGSRQLDGTWSPPRRRVAPPR